MTVDFMYQIMQFAVNKNQQGYLSPDDFNNIIEQAQLSYVNFLVGQYQQYQNGRPVSRVSFGQNSNVRQSLAPAIYGYILNVDTYGFAAYPSDYQKMDAMTDIYGLKSIRYASQDSVISYINSRIDPIASNPIYELENEGFRFYPATVGSARLSYVRKPSRIYWAYEIDGNGLPIQDVANSIDPIWYDIDCMEIIARALRLVSVNLQANDVAQYANEIKMNGQ